MCQAEEACEGTVLVSLSEPFKMADGANKNSGKPQRSCQVNSSDLYIYTLVGVCLWAGAKMLEWKYSLWKHKPLSFLQDFQSLNLLQI